MPSLSRFAGVCAIAIAAALSAPAQTSGRTIHMDVVHSKPYVMVTINGKGPFRFVVDTGTGAEALITPALADQLQLPALGQARLVDPGGLGRQRSQIFLVQSLHLAGVEFREVKAIRHSFSGEDGTCMGLLGFNLFRDYLLTLDFPNRSLTLAQGSLAADGGKSVLPFRMPDGVPLVPLRIGGKRGNERIEAQLDSGGVGLTLPEPFASRLRFASTPLPYANGVSLATRFQLKAGRLGTDVHVGRYTFARPVVEIHPAFPVANLGASAMQHFAITFDQKNLLVRFDSQQEVQHLDSMPTAMRMENAPAPHPQDQALIPVG